MALQEGGVLLTKLEMLLYARSLPSGPSYFTALSSVLTSSRAKLQPNGCPTIPGTLSALLPFFACEYSSLYLGCFPLLSST